jgi:redox-sensitive bicupin YhaK (pirin superfamily)
MGTGSVIAPGDVQRMSAGTGVLHSEYNPSRERSVHFLQIWIESDAPNIPPSYEQKRFDAGAKRGRLALIASPDGRDGSVSIHQDAYVYATVLDGVDAATHRLAPGRRGYVHAVRGTARVNGTPLSAGDAAKLERERAITLDGAHDAELLVFDLP